MGSVYSPSADPFLGVHEEVCPSVYQECSCPGSSSFSGLSLSKVADEAESQEYLDAVEKLEPEVDDLARKIVDNLNIDVSSPDDNA